MIERIEGEIHGHALALQVSNVMFQSMPDDIVHRKPLGRSAAYCSVVASTFFPSVCGPTANETIPFSIECMRARSNGMRICGRPAATADRQPRTWKGDSGAERSEAAEGKMKRVALLVPEKRVCTGFATALAV